MSGEGSSGDADKRRAPQSNAPTAIAEIPAEVLAALRAAARGSAGVKLAVVLPKNAADDDEGEQLTVVLAKKPAVTTDVDVDMGDATNDSDASATAINTSFALTGVQKASKGPAEPDPPVDAVEVPWPMFEPPDAALGAVPRAAPAGFEAPRFEAPLGFESSKAQEPVIDVPPSPSRAAKVTLVWVAVVIASALVLTAVGFLLYR